MKYLESEVFNSYIKIAEEQGLVSPTVSSKPSADDINKLYNIKNKEYKRNIIEQAHPEPVVISDAYDKINGLFENNNERQDIMLNIVNKNPDGQLFNFKMASKELSLLLASLGNALDNTNDMQLMKLADKCLELTTIKKKARSNPRRSNYIYGASAAARLGPYGWGAIAIGAILGGIFLKNHVDFISDGIPQDIDKTLAEIQDMFDAKDSYQNALGMGYEYTPKFLNEMKELRARLYKFKASTSTLEPWLDKIYMPGSAKELQEMAKDPSLKAFPAIYDKFKNDCDEIISYFDRMKDLLKDPMYKQRSIKEKGVISRLIDTAQILRGGMGLIADDFDDIAHGLGTNISDFNKLEDIINRATFLKDSTTEKLNEAATSQSYDQEEIEQESMPTSKPKDKLDDLGDKLENGLGKFNDFFNS